MLNGWLPIRRASGRVESIAPADLTSLIDSDPVVAIASARPDFDRVLLEFLIGLLATTCPPVDTADWVERYRRPPTPEELAAAFAPFADAFILDGDGPRFMQDAEALDDREKPISWLFLDGALENTEETARDVFQKRREVKALSRASAAILLFLVQTYSTQGGPGVRTSVRGGGPLTTLVIPHPAFGAKATLWNMLWANVPNGVPATTLTPSIFPWLGKTRTSNKGEITTPLDVNALQIFWSTPRRVRLVFKRNSEKISCDISGEVDQELVIGFQTRPRGANYKAGWIHPLTPYNRARDGSLFSAKGRTGVAWHNYVGFITNDGGDPPRGLPAKCVEDFRSNRGWRVLDDAMDTPSFRVTAFGYQAEAATVLAWIEGVMPLWVPPEAALLGLLDDFARALVSGADVVRRVITRAVKSALLGEGGGRGDWSWIDERFWTESEADFHRALDNATAVVSLPEAERADRTTGAFKIFFDRLKRLAFHIFDDEVSIDALADADLKTVRNPTTGLTRIVNPVVEARKALTFVLAGYGKDGKALYGFFGLPLPESGKAKSTAKGRNHER
jgi:CRISPR system Cascade subunit CasA